MSSSINSYKHDKCENNLFTDIQCIIKTPNNSLILKYKNLSLVAIACVDVSINHYIEGLRQSVDFCSYHVLDGCLTENQTTCPFSIWLLDREYMPKETDINIKPKADRSQ